MTLPTAAAEAIARLLTVHRPHSLLCLGDAGAPFANECSVRLDDAAGLPALGRFDFAVVAGLLERLERRPGEQLLARLRDLHTGRFVLYLEGGDADQDWPTGALLALGLTRIDGSDDWRLFGYDIAHYKSTPDWLNADFWANPQMWDKAWW